jgi:hypothetical protein
VRFLLLACLTLGSGLARAADDDADLFKDNTEKKPTADVPDASKFTDDDDLGIPAFTPPPAKEDDSEKDLSAYADPRNGVAANTKMPLDTVGKTPLSDNWAPSVVITDKDAVVVEMPVLYARNRAEFDGVAYWVVVEAYADGKKVAEQRIQVTRDAIADQGPSIAFTRLFAPVSSSAGLIEVHVGKATSSSAKPTPLFTRSVQYKL